MNIEPPKPPRLFGFRLTVYSSPQLLQITGGFYHASLPHLAVEEIKLSMAPSLRPYYQTSSLLRATPPSCLPSALFRCVSYRDDLFQRFLSGTYRTSPVSLWDIQDFSSFHRVPVAVSPPIPSRCDPS